MWKIRDQYRCTLRVVEEIAELVQKDRRGAGWRCGRGTREAGESVDLRGKRRHRSCSAEGLEEGATTNWAHRVDRRVDLRVRKRSADGARSGEGGAAGLGDGLELHELDAGAVGVVEGGLPLAVAAHLRAVVARRQTVLLVERSDGLLHVGDAEGEVVEDADLVFADVVGGCGGAVADHHVLEPVMAVGNLLRDPVDGVRLHGAEPVGAEAEYLTVKMVFVGAAVYEVAHVDDAAADGVRGDGDGVRVAGLEELDLVAFGVLGVEQGAAVGGGGGLGGRME